MKIKFLILHIGLIGGFFLSSLSACEETFELSMETPHSLSSPPMSLEPSHSSFMPDLLSVETKGVSRVKQEGKTKARPVEDYQEEAESLRILHNKSISSQQTVLETIDALIQQGKNKKKKNIKLWKVIKKTTLWYPVETAKKTLRSLQEKLHQHPLIMGGANPLETEILGLQDEIENLTFQALVSLDAFIELKQTQKKGGMMQKFSRLSLDWKVRKKARTETFNILLDDFQRNQSKSLEIKVPSLKTVTADQIINNSLWGAGTELARAYAARKVKPSVEQAIRRYKKEIAIPGRWFEVLSQVSLEETVTPPQTGRKVTFNENNTLIDIGSPSIDTAKYLAVQKKKRKSILITPTKSNRRGKKKD